MLSPDTPILLLTTGGTIDKVYFDALSDYQVGETVMAKLLDVARVKRPFRIEEVTRKDSLELDDRDRAALDHHAHPLQRVQYLPVAPQQQRAQVGRDRLAQRHRAGVGHLEAVKGELVVDRVEGGEAEVVEDDARVHILEEGLLRARNVLVVQRAGERELAQFSQRDR